MLRRTRFTLAAAGLVLASVAAAVPGVQAVGISLTSFALSPPLLRLKAGQPMIIRITNDSSTAHDLTAPEFFAASSVSPESAPNLDNGKVRVGAHRTIAIALVPRVGRYPMKCSHPFHRMLGMGGTILVE